tara:strand:- start:15 stop:968 length:954 start_codon:yes stop_codon:yes gene_type:complete
MGTNKITDRRESSIVRPSAQKYPPFESRHTRPSYDHTELDDTSIINEKILTPSTLETIDLAMYEFVNDRLDLFTTTNEDRKKVPVIWMSSERAFQVKNDPELRDSNEAVKLPVISIERKNVEKGLDVNKRMFGHMPAYPDARGGSIVVARKINQDKTANFQNAMANRKHKQLNFPRKVNKKVVYQTVTIPMPVYVLNTYAITLRTEYQQHMNELLTPFVTTPGTINQVVLTYEDHRYTALIDGGFTFNNNLDNLAEEERTFETVINFNVYGYLIGEGDNQKTPKIVLRENAVEVKIGREQVILGDINQNLNQSFYRE